MAADSVVAAPRSGLPLPEVPHRGELPMILMRNTFCHFVDLKLAPEPPKLESSRSAPVNYTVDAVEAFEDLSTDDELDVPTLALLDLGSPFVPSFTGPGEATAATKNKSMTDVPRTIDLACALTNSNVSMSRSLSRGIGPAGLLSATAAGLPGAPTATCSVSAGPAAVAPDSKSRCCHAQTCPAATTSVTPAGVASTPASAMFYGHLAMIPLQGVPVMPLDHSHRFQTSFTPASVSAQPIAPLLLPPDSIAPLVLPPVLPSGFDCPMRTQVQLSNDQNIAAISSPTSPQRAHAIHHDQPPSFERQRSADARQSKDTVGSTIYALQGDQPVMLAPQVPHLTRTFSIDSSVFRVHWTLHGRTLSDKTKQAVSPAFTLSFGKDFENVAFKLMLNASSKQSARKKTFKETQGKGRVQLKCEAELASHALPVRFQIGAGIGDNAEPSREPVLHNFSQSAVAALPLEQDEFDFKGVLDPTTNTFTIRLEIIPHRQR